MAVTTSREKGARLGKLPYTERDGYTFLGWYTEKEGGQQVAKDTIITGASTYYAHWKELLNYLIFTTATGRYRSNEQIMTKNSQTLISGQTLDNKLLNSEIISISYGEDCQCCNIIEAEAFKASEDSPNTTLTSVELPDSVASIGDSAFQYCSGLTSVNIPGIAGANKDTSWFGGCTQTIRVTMSDSTWDVVGTTWTQVT